MIHLTESDYTRQPWKNGRGFTVEMWRKDGPDGLLIRLSRAAVVADGPFSLFPGIERNLTVLSGPGFRLTGGGLDFRCEALVPVAFPGDVALMATETEGQQSEDFNVMTARSLPRPVVTVEHNGSLLPPGPLRAVYALGPVVVSGQALSGGDLLLTHDAVAVAGVWPVLAVALPAGLISPAG